MMPAKRNLFSFIIAIVVLCIISLCCESLTAQTSDSQLSEQIAAFKQVKSEDTAYIGAANRIVNALLARQKYDSAYYFINLALKANQPMYFAEGEARTKYLAGKWCIGRSDYAKGLQWIFESKHLYDSLGLKNPIASCDMQIGVIYYTQKKYAEAESYFTSSHQSFAQMNNRILSATTQYLRGLCRTELGDFSNAETDLLAAKKIKEEEGHLQGVNECITGLADLYLRKGSPKMAKHFYHISLSYFDSTNNLEGMAVANDGLGNVYRTLQMDDSAKYYFLQSYTESKLASYHPVWLKVGKELSEMYERENNFQQALRYQTEYYAVRDSIFNQNNAQTISNLQFDLDLIRKQSEIDLLSKQRQVDKVFRYVLIGSIVVLLIIAIMWFQRFRFKQEANRKLTKANEDLNAALQNLKDAQEKLVQQEKMASLGVLTAGIAHEINNPINFVSANVNPLKRNLDELIAALRKANAAEGDEIKYMIEESHKLIEGIDQGSKRTAEIVKGLRNFSRLDEGEMKLSDLNSGIESSLLLLNSKMKEKNIELVKSLGKIPEVKCFAGQINQVFMNLISNAIDAIGSDGKIFITTSSVKDMVRISIRDTGAGMSDAVKQKMFDPFFTTKDVGKGTGLGLSISYGIIEKHNGNIEVKSEVGKGTEFIITLPVTSVS